jgi:hypothetical protein
MKNMSETSFHCQILIACQDVERESQNQRSSALYQHKVQLPCNHVAFRSNDNATLIEKSALLHFFILPVDIGNQLEVVNSQILGPISTFHRHESILARISHNFL